MFVVISVVITVAAVALGAFGGGGGSSGQNPISSSNNTAPAPVIQSNWVVSDSQANIYRTSEYNSQWGLESIHAAEAYAVLAKNDKAIAGDNIKIAITDSGVEASHIEIANNLDVANSYNYYANSHDFSDSDGHGTHVASIAAGVKDERNMHGVAYNANIVASDIVNENYTEIDYAEAITGAASIDDVKIINASWSYSNPSGSFYTSYNGTPSGTNSRDNAIIAGLNIAKEKDILVIAAAGNDADNDGDGQLEGQDPNYLRFLKPTKPALFANNNTLEGYIIAVGAIKEYDIAQKDPLIQIADYSNICGITHDYCLMAPGTRILGAVSNININDVDGIENQKYADFTGSSMASAHVSGAAAVLRAAWPHLTAPQTGQLLLSTATDLGESGVDDIYGHGLLNLYAAVQAQGENRLSAGSLVESAGYDLRNSTIRVDPIFGDAFSRNVALALKDAVYFDDYGRDFKAFLVNKINISSHNSAIYQVNNILFNQYKNEIIPFSFNFNQQKFGSHKENHNLENASLIKFQIKSYNNNHLKFITIDNSVENKNLTTRNGFSFIQNFGKNLSAGFAFNIDELNKNNFGFILQPYRSSPYQGFVSLNLNDNRKNFNQLFFTQKFFDDKFNLNLSFQSSYQAQSILASKKKQENQLIEADFGFNVNKKTNLSFSLGKLTEFNNNLLNSHAFGAFESSSNSDTNYFKIFLDKKIIGNYSLIASVAQGITRLEGNNLGLFRDYDNIKSQNASIGLVNQNIFGGKMGAIYSEPLRISKGNVVVDIAISRDNAGNINRYRQEVSLKPSGKEQDFELYYSRNIGANSQINFNLFMVKDAGNIKSDHLNYFGLIRYDMRF